MKDQHPRLDVINRVIAAYGGVKGAQKRFKYTSPVAVNNWKTRGLPGRLLVDIHLDTDIPLRKLKAATGAPPAAKASSQSA